MAKKNDKNAIQSVIQREDAKVSANIEEQYIFTTEDKIRILYDEYNSARKNSDSIASQLGITITLIVALLTCDFKTVFGIKAEYISAFFVFATALSLFILARTIIHYFRNRHKLTFDYFFRKIQGKAGDDMTSLLVNDVSETMKKMQLYNIIERTERPANK